MDVSKNIQIDPDDAREEMSVSENGVVYVGTKYAGKTVNVAIEVVEDE